MPVGEQSSAGKIQRSHYPIIHINCHVRKHPGSRRSMLAGDRLLNKKFSIYVNSIGGELGKISLDGIRANFSVELLLHALCEFVKNVSTR